MIKKSGTAHAVSEESILGTDSDRSEGKEWCHRTWDPPPPQIAHPATDGGPLVG